MSIWQKALVVALLGMVIVDVFIVYSWLHGCVR